MSQDQKYIQDEYGKMVGKTIVGVRPLSDDEKADLMWDDHHSEVAFVVVLSDGTFFIPMSDDEGNGPGALLTGQTATSRV
jgi:hypothetical protein